MCRVLCSVEATELRNCDLALHQQNKLIERARARTRQRKRLAESTFDTDCTFESLRPAIPSFYVQYMAMKLRS